MLTSLVTVIHIASCVLIVLLVLLQHGKGADVGATFGGGSNTVFGASGADNLLTRTTTIVAAVFMLTSVFLSVGANKAFRTNDGTLFQSAPTSTPPISSSPLSSSPLSNSGAPVAPVTTPEAAPTAAPVAAPAATEAPATAVPAEPAAAAPN